MCLERTVCELFSDSLFLGGHSAVRSLSDFGIVLPLGAHIIGDFGDLQCVARQNLPSLLTSLFSPAIFRLLWGHLCIYLDVCKETVSPRLCWFGVDIYGLFSCTVVVGLVCIHCKFLED